MNKKKILVTGGAGFVGSNLCERLAQDKNNDVYSLDNYFTGSVKNHIDCVTYIKGSTADISTLVTFNPDMVYHLGEYSRVEQSFDDIKKVWKYNKDGIFSNVKPQRIPRFWYPVIFSVIIAWLAFLFFR